MGSPQLNQSQAMYSRNDNARPYAPAGSQSRNAEWKDLAGFIFERPANAEPILLFTRNAYTDACSLVGRSIIEVANELAKKDDGVIFAIGTGPCPQCNVPTLFWWNNRDWQNAAASDVDSIMKASAAYVVPKNLNYAYRLLGDRDLKITKVDSVFRRDGDTLQVMAGCQPNGEKQLQQMPNITPIWWIVIILVILFLLWLLFFRR